MQEENKTQTLRKSYTFLSKACTRKEHININNYTNNNNNNNNKQKMKERKEKETINIYLRHKGIQWKAQDCLI